MKGHNRIGNMIVPNDNYCRFEEWFQPLLDEMLAEQVDQVCSVHLVDLSYKLAAGSPPRNRRQRSYR